MNIKMNGGGLTDKGVAARQEANREVERRWRGKVIGGLFVYILIAICFYVPLEGWSPIEAVYFATVTLTTVGYGDLKPSRPGTKLFTCIYVFGGLGCIGALISKAISIIVMQQEEMIAEAADNGRLSGSQKGQVASWRTGSLRRYRWWMSIAILGGTVFVGFLFFLIVENKLVVDAFYASCISVTTVGYGDIAVKTETGRVLSVFWLLGSTALVAQALGTLIDINLEEEQKAAAARVLALHFSHNDAVQADADKDGLVSEAEFVIHQLLTMKVVEDLDDIVAQIKREYQEIIKTGTVDSVMNLARVC